MDDLPTVAATARFELERAQSRLARGADPLEVLEAFSRTLTNKLLHPAIEALKRSS